MSLRREKTSPSTDTGRPPIPPEEASSGSFAAAEPLEAAIARRAYELYEQRGCTPGHDQQDWFDAEREVRGGPLEAGAEPPRMA